MPSIKAFREQLESEVAAVHNPNRRGVQRVEESESLLKTLADSTASATARFEALRQLQILMFASPDAAKIRPRFIECLRSVAHDPDVNLAVLSVLTDMEDSVGDPSSS